MKIESSAPNDTVNEIIINFASGNKRVIQTPSILITNDNGAVDVFNVGLTPMQQIKLLEELLKALKVFNRFG